MVPESWVATAEWVCAVKFFFQVFSRCSSLFFQWCVAAVFYQPMRQHYPFWPLPLALVLVGGCNQTRGICLPRSVAATIVTVISVLYIQIVMICRVAFVALLLCSITCMHLCIIHTLVS